MAVISPTIYLQAPVVKEKTLYERIFQPTPQATFVQRLITGKTTAAERTAELKRFATGLAMVAVPVLATIFPAVSGRIATTVAKTVARKPALAIVGAGVVVSGAAPTVVKGLFKAGKVTGEVITGEKELTAETIADVAKGAGIALGLGAAGLAVGAVAKKLMEKKDGVISAIPPEIEGLVITPTPPITPETVSLEEITPLKKPSEAPRQQITQKVNVEVGIKQTGHRTTQTYLNQSLFSR